MTMIASARRPFQVGLDLDGVLCAFTASFLRTLELVTGRPVPPDYVQTTWSDWADYRASEVDEAWAYTHDVPHWWEDLAPLDHPALSVEMFFHALRSWPRDMVDVTFITTRPAVTARAQSIRWLMRQGMPNAQVLVAADAKGKGELCRLLDLDMFVDDYWHNLSAIMRAESATVPILFAQPYNANYRHLFTHVDGLPELLNLIASGAGLPSFTLKAQAR